MTSVYNWKNAIKENKNCCVLGFIEDKKFINISENRFTNITKYLLLYKYMLQYVK